MKETDYNVIANMAGMILDENDYTLTAFLGRERAIFCVMAIYTTNDICKGYGQDFKLSDEESLFGDPMKVSIISFETGVSVIVGSKSSRYQDRFPMCGYESLHDDLYQIIIDIEAAFDRIE